MKHFLLFPLAALLLLGACKKDNSSQTTDQKALEGNVLRNFTDGVARPQYNDLAAKSDIFYSDILTLQAQPTDARLAAARVSWTNMREVWARCEGFLFGPVKDDNYGAYMNTWPTDYVRIDSLLASSASLTLTNIQGIPLSLRGFHPIEYILFGNHGSRKGIDITARHKEYMISLATDLRNNCYALAASWDPAKGNYGVRIMQAGTDTSKYATRRAVLLTIVDALIGICREVGEVKMQVPFAGQNPNKVESPYSGNSVTDFRNNIIGLQNVYLGHYAADGEGLNDIVARNNAVLDDKLQSQVSAAIASFYKITHFYEDAIFDQPAEIRAAQAALAALKTTLEDELKPYINTNIQD